MTAGIANRTLPVTPMAAAAYMLPDIESFYIGYLQERIMLQDCVSANHCVKMSEMY